jgi:hypothetical protein
MDFIKGRLQEDLTSAVGVSLSTLLPARLFS